MPSILGVLICFVCSRTSLLNPNRDCSRHLQVELPADQVSREWTNVTRDFQRQARIPVTDPGPGATSAGGEPLAKGHQGRTDLQAPAESALTKRFAKRICVCFRCRRSRTSKLLRTGRCATGRQLSPRQIVELPGLFLQIPADLAREEVSDESVQRWMDPMREPHASYRAGVKGVPWRWVIMPVVTYAATLEGKPLGEVVTDAPAQLQGRRNAWIVMDEHSLLPGFSRSIVGMEVNEERTISIEMPADFTPASLGGKRLEYAGDSPRDHTKVLPGNG